MKYIMPRIAHTSAIDLNRHAMALLVRLHTITGWKMPEDDMYLNTLVSEFTKYLEERCKDLNPEEIGYAFRNYAVGVKDWGKSMNLSLINEPLQEYREQRRLLSEMEERALEAKNKPDVKELSAGECDWSDQWERIKESAKNGEIESAIILTPIYDWLERQGILTMDPEDKRDMIKSCREEYANELRVLALNGGADLETLAIVLSPDCLKHPDVKARLVNMAKIKAVKELAIFESL